MVNYLAPDAKPRNIQHALLQISEKLSQGQKEKVKKWYPRMLALTNHPVPEVRVTVAWSLGQDNQEASFHDSLQALLKDPNTLVRRNAALSLVRFGDASGRTELVSILKPVPLSSPQNGVITFRLKEDDSVSPGTLIARIRTGGGGLDEFRSPLPGFLEKKLVEDGKESRGGREDSASLAYRRRSLGSTARALSNRPAGRYCGNRTVTGKAPHMAERTRQQARLTVQGHPEKNFQLKRDSIGIDVFWLPSSD